MQNFYEEFKKPKPIIVTTEVNKVMESATECYMCGELLDDNDNNLKKIRDHCHYTGVFSGVPHNKCNKLLKKPKFIPVFFHNLGGYDERLLLRELGSSLGYVKCMYMKTDVTFLADVFEEFRNVSMETYGLDTTHYMKAPGLAWDAALKKTNVRTLHRRSEMMVSND